MMIVIVIVLFHQLHQYVLLQLHSKSFWVRIDYMYGKNQRKKFFLFYTLRIKFKF